MRTMTPTRWVWRLRAVTLLVAVWLIVPDLRPVPVAGQGGTAYGVTIPAAHPRLWWTPARLAAARAWHQSHPYNPGSGDPLGQAYRFVGQGFQGLHGVQPSSFTAPCAAAWPAAASAALRPAMRPKAVPIDMPTPAV